MAQPSAVHRGIVKNVLSGDAVVIRGQPKGGPPPERVVCLSNVTAPRLARRANPNQPDVVDSKDEPYAWEAREFLRKKLIGKDVLFTVEYKVPGTGREYGCIYIGKDLTTENVTESMVAEGLVEVRRGGIKASDESQQRLIQLEDSAKAAGKGKWAQGTGSEHVRDIKWTVDEPRKFVDSHLGKPIQAVIEHVRDGCTVRAFLLPSFHYVTVMLSGIKAPMFKMDQATGKQVPEPFAAEAKFFTEVRLLQRDVHIILESTSNQNLLGTILHPKGNIAELLLAEGFARCVDWSMGAVTQGTEKLRAAERAAKEKKLRIWKDHTPSSASTDLKDKPYQAKVIEVVNADALVVKTPNGEKKIFLASIRPPRAPVVKDENGDPVPRDPKQRMRPLYDIPYMFEAREFLRKKLIGKKVHVEVDYVQPASNEYPEKTCCTVIYGGINIGEALVSKGLAGVIRYRQDDDHRSSHYDELLTAETRAIKNAKGIHSKKDSPLHRVADISGDVAKAKQFLPFLQRAGRSEATVEYVTSGSRIRLYLPRETCLITLLLSGINCPRMERKLPSGEVIPGDAYGDEAYRFMRELCLQREVEVEVEAIDKGGNFIGWLYTEGINGSVALVSEALAKVHFTAERSPYYPTLLAAEEKAKAIKKNVWQNYEEPTETVELAEEPTERKENYKTVVVTEICNDIHFFAQSVENGPQLEKMMEHLHQELESHPPLAGAYTPKKGDLCAAKFVDGVWYRARVEKVERSKDGSVKYHILYVDYGNREVTTATKMGSLPSSFTALPPQATEYALACIGLPTDEDAVREAVDAFYNDTINRQYLLNVEYKTAGLDHVSLLVPDTKDDIAKGLVAEGLVVAEGRREKRLSKMVGEYMKAQDKAKADHLNLWRYGDFTADDAKEFGYAR